jgi:hypothetical protein
MELIDMYENDRIGFEARQKGVLAAYEPEGRDLGRVDLRSPRSGWRRWRSSADRRRGGR